MPRVCIDNREVEVDPNATILEAARQAGLNIPTLCYLQGCAAPTSCLVCVVKVDGDERLVPACATKVTDDMVVESETEEVRTARRTALELLLSDHLGDCIGPCQNICPAHMDIPAMIRQIAAGCLREAIATVKEHISLPAVLGRICPEFCEKGCRRGAHDESVSIRLLKRFVADQDLASANPYLPTAKPTSGQRVAIVGAGAAGLSAAYYLLREGHACALFDEKDQPGGMLRYAISPERLPREVLAAEIDIIRKLGAEFRSDVHVGTAPSLNDLRQQFDAVLIATGETSEEQAAALGLRWEGRGAAVHADTQMTDLPGVFVAGSALRPSQHAVRAVASGRLAAQAIGCYLAEQAISMEGRPWSVHMGRLDQQELAPLIEEASPAPRVMPEGGEGTGFAEEETRREAERCLHCDCRGLQDCKLRQYAIEYGANPAKYVGERRRFVQDRTHPEVIYEPGKCTTCGLCVQLAAELREPLGLTFVGRGFDVRVGAPFSETLAEGIKQAAEACSKGCPTGALSLRKPPGSSQRLPDRTD